MNTTIFFAGLANISVTLIMIVAAIPLVLRKVAMNRWYGIRISKSYSSQDNWYLINEYGGKAIICWCIPFALVGAGMLFASFFLPHDGRLIFEWLFPVYMIPILGALVQTLIWSRRLT